MAEKCEHRMEPALEVGQSEIMVCLDCGRVELSFHYSRQECYYRDHGHKTIVLREGSK
jgi:hypothetical protein